ncbi:MAG: hypothetical protein ACHP93_07275, partial [Solirubrobacterales bacterium]
MAPEGEGWRPVGRALLSVSDGAGLADLAGKLTKRGVELVATGGTGRTLARSGVKSRPAEELTGIGDWFGGRIKTLHPGLLGGILAPRTPEGIVELARHGLLPIDLVVVNFYPFASHPSKTPGAPAREELIDVGGVTLARAAAKNHEFVAVASDPSVPVVVLTGFGTVETAVTAMKCGAADFLSKPVDPD